MLKQHSHYDSDNSVHACTLYIFNFRTHCRSINYAKFFFQIDTLGRLFFRVLMFDISVDWSKTQNVVPANISHNNAL